MNFECVFRLFSLIFFISQTRAFLYIPGLTLHFDIIKKSKGEFSFEGEQIESIDKEKKINICEDISKIFQNEGIKYSEDAAIPSTVQIVNSQAVAVNYVGLSGFFCTGIDNNEKIKLLIGQGPYRNTYAMYDYKENENNELTEIWSCGIIDYKRKWKWHFSHELKSALIASSQQKKKKVILDSKSVALFDEKEKEEICHETITASSAEKGPMFPPSNVIVGKEFFDLQIDMDNKKFDVGKGFSCGENDGITYIFGQAPSGNRIAVYTSTSESNDTGPKLVIPFGIIEYLE